MSQVNKRRSLSDVENLPTYTSRLRSIVSLLADMCSQIPDEDALKTQREWGACFERGAAVFGLTDVLVRMCKYTQCSPGVFVSMMIYVDRFMDRTGFVLTDNNVRNVVMVAFVTAVKMNDDIYFANSYYCQLAGVTHEEFNEMERVFLTAMDWDVVVSYGLFKHYGMALKFQANSPHVRVLAPKQSCGRDRRRRVENENILATLSLPNEEPVSGTLAYVRRAKVRQAAQDDKSDALTCGRTTRLPPLCL